MEFEVWWLLGVPAMFGMGWLAARIDIKHLVTESRALPRSYFRGLNFLLNEQPDKAIEAFIEVVRIDPETVELLQGLGSTLECLNTHFLDTGDFCVGAGVDDPWLTGADGHRPGIRRGGN